VASVKGAGVLPSPGHEGIQKLLLRDVRTLKEARYLCEGSISTRSSSLLALVQVASTSNRCCQEMLMRLFQARTDTYMQCVIRIHLYNEDILFSRGAIRFIFY
jgi:hypothetical protein